MNITQKESTLILVADDDQFTRLLLRQLLEQEGYQVAEVENGEQCLAAYMSYKPDMVLLDAVMPVMDGFNCCTQLQRLPNGERTPILMITALNDQKSVDCAFEAGATDFVTKPVHPPVLCRRVRRLLEASRAEAALRESEKKYRSVVENVREVIFQTDIEGLWTFLNPAWTEITGFTIAESINTNFLNYIHPDDRQVNLELFQLSIEGNKESYRQEIRYLTKKGGFVWIEIHAQFNLAEDGSVTGTSGTLKDVTKRRQAEALEREKVRLETEIIERQRSEKTIRNALTREKELSELKSRVITTISHEFRTPLTTILSSTDLLEIYNRKGEKEKIPVHIFRIQAAAEQMANLVSNVLTISEVETEKIQFNPSLINLRQFCQQLVEELQLIASNKPTLNFVVQGSCAEACMDGYLLRQILSNILANAIKFTPQGGNVQFDLVFNPDEAIFYIRDEGIGIPLHEQARVWNAFERGSNVGTISGTGMGLTIAKKSVDLHNGRISLDSEVGVGTTFTIALPLKCAGLKCRDGVA
jgi:PAS domain S-box-containing protein